MIQTVRPMPAPFLCNSLNKSLSPFMGHFRTLLPNRKYRHNVIDWLYSICNGCRKERCISPALGRSRHGCFMLCTPDLKLATRCFLCVCVVGRGGKPPPHTHFRTNKALRWFWTCSAFCKQYHRAEQFPECNTFWTVFHLSVFHEKISISKKITINLSYGHPFAGWAK